MNTIDFQFSDNVVLWPLSFMRKIFTIILGVLLAILPFTVKAFSGSEILVTKDGTASVSGAKVMQIAGSTFFARLYWGEAYLRFTIKTDGKTKFLRATGEATTLNEVSESDLLDVSGYLESGSNTLNLVAGTVKNSSVEKLQSTFSGTVTSVDLSLRQFKLNTKSAGLITVSAGTTTEFRKGSRTLDLEHVKVGNYISKTAGDYNLKTKTLEAKFVVTYIDPNYYKPQLFVGRLEEIIGTTLPTSVKVTVGGIKYTVNLTLEALILNKNRDKIVLNRFVVGDTVRLYGIIREVDEPIIDAEVIRNINL